MAPGAHGMLVTVCCGGCCGVDGCTLALALFSADVFSVSSWRCSFSSCCSCVVRSFALALALAIWISDCSLANFILS